MEIGVYTVGLGDMPLEEKIRWAGANKFQAIEVACWQAENNQSYYCNDLDVTTLDAKKAGELVALLREQNLNISSLAYYENNLNADLGKRRKVHAYLKKCIDAAVLLGAPSVGTFVGRDRGKTIAENMDEFQRVFTHLVEYAEERGVRIVIENCPMEGWQVEAGLPGNLFFSPELWQEMFQRVPNKNFGINFDPSHMLVQFMDYIEPLHRFRERILHVHAKDSCVDSKKLEQYGVFNRLLGPGKKEGYWDYTKLGDGQVDFENLLQTLKHIGYTGVVSIEYEHPVYGMKESEVIRTLLEGRDFLKRYI